MADPNLHWVLIRLSNGNDYAVQTWEGDDEKEKRGALLAQGHEVIPLVPATPVVVGALTVFTILCGVDEDRIAAAELLDHIKRIKDAAQ